MHYTTLNKIREYNPCSDGWHGIVFKYFHFKSDAEAFVMRMNAAETIRTKGECL